jgi:hypothetical protein
VYFTSEVGYKAAQRYVETPGDKAWANHAWRSKTFYSGETNRSRG